MWQVQIRCQLLYSLMLFLVIWVKTDGHWLPGAQNLIKYETFSLPETPHFWLKHSYTTNWHLLTSWSVFDLPWCLKYFPCAEELNNKLFKNLHLIAFGDLDLVLTSRDPQNAFSGHRSSKIDVLKICTRQPWLVTLNWFWPPMMPKMLFLYTEAQK